MINTPPVTDESIGPGAENIYCVLEEYGENKYSHGAKVLQLNLKNKPVITRPVPIQSHKLTQLLAMHYVW
jgi:hypothetical protein